MADGPERASASAGLIGALLFACGSALAAPAYRPTHGSEILWDRYGVAHVDAKSVPDLFFGFGWARASG